MATGTIYVNTCYVGINENNSSNTTTIYPNPFTDQTIITFYKEQKKHFY